MPGWGEFSRLLNRSYRLIFYPILTYHDMKRRARDIFNQLDYQYLFNNLSYKSMQFDIPTL